MLPLGFHSRLSPPTYSGTQPVARTTNLLLNAVSKTGLAVRHSPLGPSDQRLSEIIHKGFHNCGKPTLDPV